MQEFLNPKSMMTPGIAGATMMFIVNGIVFAFPELPARIVALILSFLIGSIVFAAKSDLPSAIWARSVYWVVNSLIIFVVGFGTANLASSNTAQAQPHDENGSLFPALITSAYAQSDDAGSASAAHSSAAAASARQTELTEQLELERKKNADLAEQLKKLKASETSRASTGKQENDRMQQQEPQFFRQW